MVLLKKLRTGLFTGKDPMSKDSQTPQQGQRINIELPPEKAEGVYANASGVAHSPNEFILDFIQLMPGLQKARVVQRVIMAPPVAKAFLKNLEQNLQHFEERHGKLPEPSAKGPLGYPPGSTSGMPS